VALAALLAGTLGYQLGRPTEGASVDLSDAAAAISGEQVRDAIKRLRDQSERLGGDQRAMLVDAAQIASRAYNAGHAEGMRACREQLGR
jgi:hypothetical protein